MFVIFSVFYILIAASMIVLILMQRGAGADAGSGFGGGASATVFGARGSSNFLSRATGVLAALFFLLSLGMGIYLSHNGGVPRSSSADDLGVMSGVANKAASPQNAQPAAPSNSDVPQAAKPANSSDVPAAPAAASSSKSDVPAAGKPAGAK
jgi:preprotein translocase subunit SecG